MSSLFDRRLKLSEATSEGRVRNAHVHVHCNDATQLTEREGVGKNAVVVGVDGEAGRRGEHGRQKQSQTLGHVRVGSATQRRDVAYRKKYDF